MKMMKRHKSVFVTQFCILIGVLAAMTVLGGGDSYGNFKAEKVNYALINRDSDGPVIWGLEETLRNRGNEKKLADDKETLMDAGFYQAVDGIVIVPEGFEEAFESGREKALELWMGKEGMGYYIQSVTEQYLSLVRMYRDSEASMTAEEMAEAAAASMKHEAEVSLRNYGDGETASERFLFFQRFLPYFLFQLCLACVNLVFLNFKKPEIRMRNLCSPNRPSYVAVQKLLYALTVGVAAWICVNGAGIIISRKEWGDFSWQGKALLWGNSFLVMLVAICVSLLCSCFVESVTTQNFVTNFVSLAICFLSGVFVPLELMSDSLKNAAQVLPVYWYEANVEKICRWNAEGAKIDGDIWLGLGIQGGFALALFCVYLVVNKYKEREAEAFGGIRTELEL